ncbi:hypothetical protein CANINC_001301 [Pichia inconspicua]|uniref:pyridoxal 5'-phosphate synthase n=1 Tax=Pichia inconspicua TaxID=52247 RepID=A0A4T0X430_9ASCO|nr:hypothetical protein CANINC_001301 [[Candida] inconspicua]
MNLDLPKDKTYQQGDGDEKLLFAPETYQYTLYTLNESDIANDPITQFNNWFKDAQLSGEPIPESLVLSTCNLETGRVSGRVVLLKELDTRGWLIFSNWDTSKKSIDIKTNKFASLTFLWKKLQRQVRIEGLIEELTPIESAEYFSVRPRGSKIGAWASPQSKPIENRLKLEERVAEFEKKFENLPDNEIPCPPKWGGIRIVPLEVEFWQGRESRLHDRLTFTREKIDDNNWKLTRLAP